MKNLHSIVASKSWHNSPIQIPFIEVSRQIRGSRWYATEPETRTLNNETEVSRNTETESHQIEDSVIRELEGKSKEVADWKVGRHV